MKIVRIFGGLGNQMFQYSLAMAFKNSLDNEDVYVDTSCMNGYPFHNGYELQRIFNVSIKQASISDLIKVAYPLPHYRLWQLGRHVLPKRKTIVTENPDMRFMEGLTERRDSFLAEGYWQTEKYFSKIREIILDTFKFPQFERGTKNEYVANRISDCESVSLHIRRGDYLKIADTGGICTIEYYSKSINILLEKVKPQLLVIFSDDPAWCKNNLLNVVHNIPVIYVDWNKGTSSFKDMQLMSLCSHNIIANSSFSWWGGWLNQNPNKIVIAPSRWMNCQGWSDIIPEDWTIIKI